PAPRTPGPSHGRSRDSPLHARARRPPETTRVARAGSEAGPGPVTIATTPCLVRSPAAAPWPRYSTPRNSAGRPEHGTVRATGPARQATGHSPVREGRLTPHRRGRGTVDRRTGSPGGDGDAPPRRGPGRRPAARSRKATRRPTPAGGSTPP